MEQYKRESSGDALEEFDSSREVVQDLIAEYIACESPDYLEWKQEERDDESDVRAPKASLDEDISAYAE